MVPFLGQVLKLINHKALANVTWEVISVKQLLSELRVLQHVFVV
jgi:hypothetical protein